MEQTSMKIHVAWYDTHFISFFSLLKAKDTEVRFFNHSVKESEDNQNGEM